MIPPHYIALSSLSEWADNYNHGDVTAIARSIRRFGFNSALRVWQNRTVMAGNHTCKALRLIQEQGPDPELDRNWPPQNILIEGDEWYVSWVDMSHLSSMEATAFAVGDNHIARQAAADDDRLARYLQEIAAEDLTLLLATGYDQASLELLLADLAEESIPQPDSDPSEEESALKGTLLALTEVTIAPPRHRVQAGDVWRVGHHVLICADVLKGWATWRPYLKGERTLFAPYPGPFVPLMEHQHNARVIMVQPDPYIAGHILDRYAEVHGEHDVRKQT